MTATLLTRRTALAALAAPAVPAARARAAAPLVVWINGDKGHRGVQEVGAAFERDTGVAVRVEHPENAVSKFEQAAAAGKGPDIWIWPHDRAGSWARAGLVSPVQPPRALRDATEPLALDAWRIGGRTWGYPIAIEAAALICNRALVPVPPKDWDEVFAIEARMRPSGRHAIMWPFNEFYYAYPLVSAGGGYAFRRRADGSYDASDTGIDSAGARAGMRLLVRMVREGLVPRTATYAEAEAAINEGRVAMTINGPWSWTNLAKSGLDCVAAPLPALHRGGRAGGPMVGVLGAMITSACRQRVLATEFIERYLVTPNGLEAMHRHVPLGVPAQRAVFDRLAADPLIAGTRAAALAGEPMPNVPEMARFWSAMNAAVQNITQGRESVEDGLARAARRVRGDGA